MSQRSRYDIMMQENYNPLREGYHQDNTYHTAPWHTPRTKSDSQLQQRWCPDCKDKKQLVEGYAPLYGFRTKYDQELQQMWCPSCPGQKPTPRPTPRPTPGPSPDPYA